MVVYIIYAAVLSFAGTVGLSLLLYSGIDYFRNSRRSASIIEALSGVIILAYLLVFHLEGFTENVTRQLFFGGPTTTAYVALPALLALVTTDFLLRRIVPLVSGLVVPDNSGDGDGTGIGGKIRSRRSVLGVVAGFIAASQVGGTSLLRGMLQSPIPEDDDTAEFDRQVSFDAPFFPTALDFTDDGEYGYLTNRPGPESGKIFRFELPSADQESLTFDEVASSISEPHGVEVSGDTLYTVDNGSAVSGKYGEEEGYDVLQDSNGTVIAFDIESDGSLSNRRTLISDLPVVNNDHALQQIETGPDGRLYLSIGHLGGSKYPEMFDGKEYTPSSEDHPNAEYLGTVISFESDGSDIEIMASGLRNMYDFTFDEQGEMFGANNDGMSMRSREHEALYHITEGANLGYPEYGTFDSVPTEEEILNPLWTLDHSGSTGGETTDKLDGDTQEGVLIGSSSTGDIAFVPIEREDGGVYVPELLGDEPTAIELNDSPIILEAGPDGSLWVGSTGRDDLLSLYQPS